jgi:glycosyltransferase involved in cell wall biosynthesis
MINYYEAFSNLCAETIKYGHELEQEALDTCKLAIYSSDWAAQSAIEYYKASPDKIKVVPFGANVHSELTFEEIKGLIATRTSSVCKLLFLGVDWERKGGAVAFETARILNEAGLKTELHIVGIKNVPINNLPPFMKLHGFISKASKEGMKKFNDLIGKSHFLILPTKADCTPVVFSEACSFGLPILTTNTGGISTIVKENINGKAFEVTSPAQQYAEFVLQKFNNYNSYHDLALSSFEDYRNRLNWKVSGKRMVELMKSL